MKNKMLYTLIGLLICTTAFPNEKLPDKYSAYVGPAPHKREDKLYLLTKLNDFSIVAKSLEQAMDAFVVSFRKHTKLAPPSVIIRTPNTTKFKNSIRIEKGTLTMAQAIDKICVQAGASWNYSNGRITIKPKK